MLAEFLAVPSTIVCSLSAGIECQHDTALCTFLLHATHAKELTFVLVSLAKCTIRVHPEHFQLNLCVTAFAKKVQCWRAIELEPSHLHEAHLRALGYLEYSSRLNPPTIQVIIVSKQTTGIVRIWDILVPLQQHTRIS